MTARAEWAAKTGLPPHLFEASKVELAHNAYEALKALDTAKTERAEAAADERLSGRMRADVLQWHETQIKRTEALYVAFVDEWERRQ